MEGQLANQFLTATKLVEQKVDEELEKLEQMDAEEMEILRKQRLDAMKKKAKQKEEFLKMGHGQYEELADEKEFFDASKKSPNMVCHFYRDSAFRCKIVDKHLAILARKHPEARFVKLDAEKAPFLTERLRVRVIPTIALVRDSKTKDYIVGFTDLGNRDDFSTDMMEWRIAQSGAIEYSGDLLTPPDQAPAKAKISILGAPKEKTIKGRAGDSDDSDDDW